MHVHKSIRCVGKRMKAAAHVIVRTPVAISLGACAFGFLCAVATYCSYMKTALLAVTLKVGATDQG